MEELKSKSEQPSEAEICEKVDITQGYIKTAIPYTRLYHTLITPKPELVAERKGIKCSVLIFHGFAENSSSSIQMATHLAIEGTFECHLIDFHGFGYSTGVRGYADLIELQHDIVALIAEVVKRNTSRNLALPTFIIANSYAANVAAGLLINNPDMLLAGVVMCSPAFSTHYQYSQLSFYEKILHLYIYPLVQVLKYLAYPVENKADAIPRSRTSG